MMDKPYHERAENLVSIEVEVRGVLTKDEHQKLIEFLDKNAKNRQEDDRKTTFFIIPGSTLKVAHSVSRDTAKVAFKKGDIIEADSQVEYEFAIDPLNFDTAVDMFKGLGFSEIQETFQSRINYEYNGIEFAVKWSKDLGYHFEAEIVTKNKSEVQRIRQFLQDEVKKLGLETLSKEEFRDICLKVQKEHQQRSSE